MSEQNKTTDEFADDRPRVCVLNNPGDRPVLAGLEYRPFASL